MEEFAKTLNNLGQDAIKGAKKLKDIAAVNIEIAQEEDKRKNNFIAMGKLYYEMYADKPEDAFIEICKLIEKSDEKIALLKQKLSTLKGLKKCGGCNTEIKADSVFCPYCGKETDFKSESTDSTKCALCGEKLAEGASYCSKCGNKLQ